MKIFIAASLFFFCFTAAAANKAEFSIFGGEPKFAEVTCRGLTGFSGSRSLRLPALEGTTDTFEAYVDMIPPYKLVITASSASDGRTLYLAFAREDATPTMASTKGLDLALRIGSGMDVYCELNAGAQITR